MKKLIKENPNDADLGRAVRKQYLEKGDEALDLLRGVLLLHGAHHDLLGISNALTGIDAKIIEFIKNREV